MLVRESISFERGLTPQKSLDLGWDRTDNNDIRKFMAPVDEITRESSYRWIFNRPDLMKELEIKNELDNFENIIGFEEDYIAEEYDIDPEEWKNQIISKSPWKNAHTLNNIKYLKTSYKYMIAELITGGKIILYEEGLFSGYIARKEWIK